MGQDDELQALIARQRAEGLVTLLVETGDQEIDHFGVVVDHDNSGGRRSHHPANDPHLRGGLRPASYAGCLLGRCVSMYQMSKHSA